MRFFIATLALLLCVSARAQNIDGCGFVPRAAVETYLTELPMEITGWVSCYDKHPEVGVFLVARFAKHPERVELESFLLDYAKKSVGDGVVSSVISDDAKLSGLRQVLLKTTRPNGNEQTLHFAFEAQDSSGQVVLYIQTLGERDFLRNRKLIEILKHELSLPTAVDQLK